MLESHSQDSDARWPEPSGEESRPKREVAHAWCLFLLCILTQNPGVRWPGLRSDVLRVLTLHQHAAVLLQTTPHAETPADWRCLGSPPDLEQRDTSPSTPDWFKHMFWNEVIWEAKDFLLEGLSAVAPVAHPGHERWWSAPPLMQQTSLMQWAAGKDARPGSGKPETCYLLSWYSSHIIVVMS